MERDRQIGSLSRRKLLTLGLVGLRSKGAPAIAGGWVNDSFQVGHQIRDGKLQTPRNVPQIRVPIVIAGGGMAGLSAAWWLLRHRCHDFVLLELEKQAGGNSRWGENEVSAYPWAAHYVPLPNKETVHVRELLEELGVMKDGKADERYLCFEPQERLYAHGKWWEDLEPALRQTPVEREEFKRFEEQIGAFRASGKFKIPLELGDPMPELDRLTMAEWLRQHRYRSPGIWWYADYACRDDYGSSVHEASAWAGIHYFAARQHDEKGPLTWPEGNGWIARRLIELVKPYLRVGAPVYRISARGSRWTVRTAAADYLADQVIYAMPPFLAPHLIEGFAQKPQSVYSPWITANLTLHRPPSDSWDQPAWDNVLFRSPSLGYVDAKHMNLGVFRDQSVWTYYRALVSGDPLTTRKQLLRAEWRDWRDEILRDLALPHPDLAQSVTRIDVMRMGHAMVRPVPGYQSSAWRKLLVSGWKNIHFAHTEGSGISIFEQAQYQGVQAAQRVLGRKV